MRRHTPDAGRPSTRKWTCISADTHVVEPGDLWVNYIAAEYRERAPKVEDRGDHEIFVCDGEELLPIGSVAAAGVPAGQVSRGLARIPAQSWSAA